MEDTGNYLQPLRKLNQGLDPDNYKNYDLKEEPNKVRLMLIIDYLYHGAGDVRMATIQRRESKNLLPSWASNRKREVETDMGKMMRSLNLDMASFT